MDISISEAIQKVKDVGLNVYTPRTKDAGFVKLYLKPMMKIMPHLSGNALKVLITLSYGLYVLYKTPCKEIENLTGLSGHTVRAALDELEEKMVVKRLGPNVRRSYAISNCYVRVGKKQIKPF